MDEQVQVAIKTLTTLQGGLDPKSPAFQGIQQAIVALQAIVSPK